MVGENWLGLKYTGSEKTGASFTHCGGEFYKGKNHSFSPGNIKIYLVNIVFLSPSSLGNTKKKSFRCGEIYYIFLRIACTDQSFPVRTGAFIRNVNSILISCCLYREKGYLMY